MFDGEVVIVEEVRLKEISVHSRVIKTKLANGDIELVNRLLNRTYAIDGKVVLGQGLGKKKLVPTLNLNVYDYDLPKDGVYMTRTKVEEKWLNSVSFIGFRKTTDGSFAIETHVIDKDIGIVRGKVYLEFVDFLRENKKFDSLSALRKQIDLDIIQVKNNLK